MGGSDPGVPNITDKNKLDQGGVMGVDKTNFKWNPFAGVHVVCARSSALAGIGSLLSADGRHTSRIFPSNAF